MKIKNIKLKSSYKELNQQLLNAEMKLLKNL